MRPSIKRSTCSLLGLNSIESWIKYLPLLGSALSVWEEMLELVEVGVSKVVIRVVDGIVFLV